MGRIHDLLAAMTLEEKAGQLNHLQGIYSTDPYAKEINLEGQIREGKVGAVTTSEGIEALRTWQKMAVEESRLGIPLLFANDVIHGFRTIFPIPLGQAASWNMELIEGAERVSAIEGSAAGLNWTFTPMVDVARDPRWGRTMEGGGEDPFFVSAIAAARVRGLQGKNLRDKDTLIACLKHFAAYGAAEGGREYNTTDVSESRLREVYLPPFEAGVKAGARTVMNGFNSLNGVPVSCSHHLLTEILKGEWGFEGITVSDAFSIFELIPHGVAESEREAAIKCFLAGSDTDLWPGIYCRELPGLVREGLIPESLLDRSTLGVLALKEECGLLDDPFGRFDEERLNRVVFCPAHREAAKETAIQSFVLLKSESAFPLPSGLKKLAVIGDIAHSRLQPDLMGGWSAQGRMEEVVTILEGLQQALPGVEVAFAQGWTGFGEVTPELLEEAVDLAAASDAVVLVLGERGCQTGEGASRSDITLPGRQDDLARAVIAAQPRCVTLLACGRALALEGFIDLVPNLLVIWQPGTEAGSAAAEVVLGHRHPSGRLPAAFPRRVGQLPMSYRALPTGRPRKGPEDVSWGTSRYSDVENEPLFPFGFGLTLTEPGYGEVTIAPQEINVREKVTVSLAVTNPSDQPLVEVVQLYIRDVVASRSRPLKELKGFCRVELGPQEVRRVEFELSAQDLRFWMDGEGWVVEPGRFDVFVGRDAACPLVGSFLLKN
jgi:beta-glucosidase